MKIPIWVRRWNKKIHIYLGLFILLFLWLFSLSGLLLNHHDWFQHSERPERVEFERPFESLPRGSDAQAKAEDLRDQLGLSGEILRSREGQPPPPPGHFTFALVGVERVTAVDADLEKLVATIRYPQQSSDFVVFRRAVENLHTLTGVRGMWREPDPKVRDWWVVQLWSFSMDAVAVGFIVLVFSSFYMWYQRRRTWLLGSVVFGAGIICCGFFLWGIRWLT